MAPTPLIASAPTLRNCVGVGKLNDGRRFLRSGEADGVRVIGGAVIEVAFSERWR